MSRWPGGLIRKTAITPAGPFQDGAAPGVWTIMEAAYWQKQGLWPVAGKSQRALFSGGVDSGFVTYNTISYITISTLGNATDFGDLITGLWYACSLGSSTRGIVAGGEGPGTSTYVNVIQYVTIASTGNSADFGDLLSTFGDSTLGDYPAAFNNSTRGVIAGGSITFNNRVNIIQYITIATLGNALDFGDLLDNLNLCAGFSSPTRGVIAGGWSSAASLSNTIQYVTIASTGNSTDFGDLIESTRTSAGCSNNTRGLVAGNGATNSNLINYITIASTGNAEDFGDLSFGLLNPPTGAASSTRATLGGGTNNPVDFGPVNIIQYVTIASTGNGQDFGDLTLPTFGAAACSNVNGGL